MPASPYEEVEETAKQQLGRPLSELFASVEREALASASVAQVHRCTLKDGREAVIKVRNNLLPAVAIIWENLLAVFWCLEACVCGDHRGEIMADPRSAGRRTKSHPLCVVLAAAYEWSGQSVMNYTVC